MGGEARSVSKVRRGALAALVGALLPIVAPIVWDWYSHRVGLEFQLLSEVALVSSAASSSHLSVRYDSLPIESLSRVEIGIVNTGRTPLRSSDFVSPPTLSVENGAILQAEVESREPGTPTAQVLLDSTRQAATLLVPLLNPREEIGFNLLVSGAPTPVLRAAGRAAGLGAVRIVDQLSQHRSFWRRLAWTAYPVALGTTIAGLALAIFIYGFGRAQLGRHVWDWGLVRLTPPITADTYKHTLSTLFNPTLASSLLPGPVQFPSPVLPDSTVLYLNSQVQDYIRETKRDVNRLLAGALVVFVMGGMYLGHLILAAAAGPN